MADTVGQLVEEGFPQDQAVAIVLNQAGKATGKELGSPRPGREGRGQHQYEQYDHEDPVRWNMRPQTIGWMWRLVGVTVMPPLLFLLGFVLGIVPGLLLGLPGWHQAAAIVFPILWSIGYVAQRNANYRDVSAITLAIAAFGSLGFGTSVWLFGSVTS